MQYRPARLCLSAVLSILGLVGFGPQTDLAAQAQTVTVRPNRSYDVAGFGNPNNAWDNNETTAGGGAMSRMCFQHCTMPISMTASWDGFGATANYAPVRLEVKWSAASAKLLINSTSRVQATIEYTLGGPWETLEAHIWNSVSTPPCPSPSDQGIACPDHVATLPLSPLQNLADVRVRASLTVGLPTCNSCVVSSSNVTGTISVYDVRIIAERPALKLFLDASGDFNAAAPDDDLPTYVPGNNFSSHQPEDIPEEGNPIHTVYVVAAYVLANGQIAPPPDGVSRALFLLTDVSAYAGMAMNLTGNAGDLVMPDSAVDFLPDHTARSALMVYDYAAWGHVIVTAGSDSQQMWVPKDNDWNGIADVGWNSADGTPVPDAFGSNVWADQDPDPTGDSTDGDGLGAIEEYRGFRVNGHIRRLDTGRKDLFIYSEHPQSIGDAASLPLNLHLLQAGEMDTETRIINPYFENTGYGPSDGTTTGPPLRSESAFQRGLYVIDGLDSGTGAVGATPRAVAGDVVPNDVSGPIEIYTSTIRKASPPHNTLTDVDPLDEPKNNQTLGHEIGHGSHIPHWRVDTLNPDCSDAAVFEQRDPTVMVTCWLRGPDDERWNNLPHVYDPTDLSHLRIKKVQQ